MALLAVLSCCLCWRFKRRRAVRAAPQPIAWPKEAPSAFVPPWRAQPESVQPALQAAGPSLVSMHSISLEVGAGITPAPVSQPRSEATTEAPQSSSGTRPSTGSLRALSGAVGASAVGRVWRGRIRKPGADAPRRRALRSATDGGSSDTGGLSEWPSVMPHSSTAMFEGVGTMPQPAPPTARFGPRHVYVAASEYTTLVPESSALVPDSDASYVPASESGAPPPDSIQRSIFVTAPDSSALVPESDATHAPNSETLETLEPCPTARSSVDSAWRRPPPPPPRWRMPSPRSAYTSAPGSLTSYGSDLASQSTAAGSFADHGAAEPLALLPARSAALLRSHYRFMAATPRAGVALRGPNSNLVGRPRAGATMAVARLRVAQQHLKSSDSSLMSAREQPVGDSTLHDNSLTLRLPYLPTPQAAGPTIYHNSTYVHDRALREESGEGSDAAAGARKGGGKCAGGAADALWKQSGGAAAEVHAPPRSALCSTGLVSLSTLAEGSSCAHLLSSQTHGDCQGCRESEGSDGAGPARPRVSDGSARASAHYAMGPQSALLHSQAPHHGVSRERSAAATFGNTLPTHLEA